ncbi:hypothetical protein [Natrinema sp. 1APR25-10V2]|uniref:hypothetical protein n=1 Tax=Natrinema sp. 1APR25-10V2 TaxID=2951081 RepID=UPI00287673E4|nr:hypothetical protein [Natrinema sp. 1APR25-10V2]MDS0478601.1 hypothetical protein [Natrinema sp. 1APR25-10V2]
MYVTDKAEIVIDASPEEIWEYVTDPVHWRSCYWHVERRRDGGSQIGSFDSRLQSVIVAR